MSTQPESVVAGIFSALGDGTRLAVLAKLSGGAASATTLAGGARVTRQAIVKHLRVLEDAGLLTRERHGREVLYVVEERRMEEARAFLEMISAGWDRAIDRLRTAVEDKPRGARKGRGRR